MNSHQAWEFHRGDHLGRLAPDRLKTGMLQQVYQEQLRAAATPTRQPQRTAATTLRLSWLNSFGCFESWFVDLIVPSPDVGSDYLVLLPDVSKDCTESMLALCQLPYRYPGIDCRLHL